MRIFFRHSGLPSDTKQVPEYLARRLGEAYERFLKTAPSNSYAVVDEDGWHLSAEATEKLDQEEQDRPAHLKSWLAKHMRHVKLPDLLTKPGARSSNTSNFTSITSACTARWDTRLHVNMKQILNE